MSPVDYLRGEHAQLTELRRDLHAHPELGFEEHRTAKIVTGELDRLGVEYHAGIGRTGIVAVIPGERNESRRAVGLRRTKLAASGLSHYPEPASILPRP